VVSKPVSEYLNFFRLSIDQSKFEMNVNHTLSLQAAISLGCTVVNIGPEDLTDKKHHLVLGILWQVIKKALLKSINLSSNPELSRLQNELLSGNAAPSSIDEDGNVSGNSVGNIATMAPEQVLLQWFNYHLKRAHFSKGPLKNFGKDISSGEAYAILLHQIDPEHVSEEDVKAILETEEPLKRSEMLIDCARKVLNDDQSLFVGAEDIVSGNPRLNLAFTATLFNSHPSLGPSLDEIHTMEMEHSQLKRENQSILTKAQQLQEQIEQLSNSVSVLELSRTNLNEKIEAVTSEKEQLQQSLQQFHKQLQETSQQLDDARESQRQSENQVQLHTENISRLQSQLQECQQTLERVTAEFSQEKTNWERQLSESQEQNAHLTRQLQKTNEQSSSAQDQLQQKGDELRSLLEQIEEMKKRIEELNARIKALEEELKQTKEQLQKTIETKDKQIAELTKELENLKKGHEEAISKLNQDHQQKVNSLQEVIQKLQDMMPERAEMEGFLTKQGGSHKNWQKRYFVLKTNFMCYYKDQKNLKHPAGVIDLSDARMGPVTIETIKKKNCFEIATPKRIYYLCSETEEEQNKWLEFMERAKARLKSELSQRKTFSQYSNQQQ